MVKVRREPIKETEFYFDYIPTDDSYIENYEKISNDHLRASPDGSYNPFIPPNVVDELLNDTKKIISEFSFPNSNVLDIGVGLGDLISDYKDLNRFGIDISSTYLEHASRKGISCFRALVEDLPFEDDQFDMVVCTDVLEHVLDFNKAISEILRVLKPNGVFILRVPYREDLSPYLDPKCPYEYVHLRNFDENSLELGLVKVFPVRKLLHSFSGFIPSDPKLIRKNTEIFGFRWIGYHFREKVLRTFFPSYYKSLFYPLEIIFVVRSTK